MRAPEPDCWLHPDVEVRPSDVAGRGLFAGTGLPRGAEVARLGGRLVDTAALEALVARDDGYVDTVAVDDDLHLVLPPGTDVHFGNHGCDPNLGWADEYTLVTVRDVAAGEELLHDYATSTADPGFYLRCHCPSARCRQMVEGTDWRIPQLQQRYAGHWTPYLQRLIDVSRGSGS